MTATVDPVTTDRIAMRVVIGHGFKIGVLTGLGVIVFIYGSGLFSAGLGRAVFQLGVVFALGFLVAFLPGIWVNARDGEGVAVAALIGLIGTATFTLIDIVMLRAVLHSYPWTWDGVGGGSGWWYLPVWWMLGTFTPWMGALIVSREATRGPAFLGKLLVGSAIGTALLTVMGLLATDLTLGPVVVGGALVVTLVCWALFRLVSKTR